MPNIPDRWLAYTAMGQVIPGTKFICFKVPLKKFANNAEVIQNEEVFRGYAQKTQDVHFICHALNNNLETKDRFSPDMLLEKCPELGLVIDLTNTKRYYNSVEFLSKGVYYKKIFCPGRVVPPPVLVSTFIKSVDDFLDKTQDKLIGVHCTHGVNRTGYFVCSYMIRRLGMPPEDAVSEYEKARGHRIERELYVEDLQNASEKELPPPPNEDEEEVIGNKFGEPQPIKRERHRNRKRRDDPSHSADGQSRSDKGFQQGHFNHARNCQNWRQCSDGACRGYPLFREPYHHQGQGIPAYQPATSMPSSSGPLRTRHEHLSPLSGAYDDDNQSSFSRYGNRQWSIRNYQGHRSSLNAADGPNRGRNNTRQNYNTSHWRRRDGSQNNNSDRS